MKYRKLDASGDYTFARGPANFHINTPEAVAQAVKTRLALVQGEWFLDITEGVPYKTQILGKGTTGTYDQAIRQRIIETEGVLSIVNYSSNLNRGTRSLRISVTINTVYGSATIDQVFVP